MEWFVSVVERGVLRSLFLMCLGFSQVNGRIISKQIHVRVEHVSPSKCRDELKRRVKENEAAKKEARAGGGECAPLVLLCSLALTERDLLVAFRWARVQLFYTF